VAYDEKTAERVRSFLSGRSDVIEKKLMGGLCFMVKGAMCCSVSSRGGLLVRVGAEARERMLGQPHVRPMEMAGRTVSGFVRVMPEGYRTETVFRKWIQRGVDFVEELDAKRSRTGSQRDVPKRRWMR
jgi:TfoX/Sxy family transcriptional regulator of competence genes